MGRSVNDLIVEILYNPEFHEYLGKEGSEDSFGKSKLDKFAGAIEYGIDTNDAFAIDLIIQATKKNELHGIQLITIILTRAMLGLKLIQYLNDNPKICNRPPDKLYPYILSWTCSLKASEINSSYTATWEQYIGSSKRKPKKPISNDDPEKVKQFAIVHLSVLFTLHEKAVNEAFSSFELVIDDQLIPYSAVDVDD